MLHITSLFKKGDRSQPGNYRGISVMNSMSKLFATCVTLMLEEEAASKRLRAATQGGFRKGFRLEDQCWLL